MSSVDLHTHSGFQRMLPESFAVVCAARYACASRFVRNPDLRACCRFGFRYRTEYRTSPVAVVYRSIVPLIARNLDDYSCLNLVHRRFAPSLTGRTTASDHSPPTFPPLLLVLQPRHLN